MMRSYACEKRGYSTPKPSFPFNLFCKKPIPCAERQGNPHRISVDAPPFVVIPSYGSVAACGVGKIAKLGQGAAADMRTWATLSEPTAAFQISVRAGKRYRDHGRSQA